MTNFIGRSIEREEDIKLLQGEARFVDDMPFRKDTLHAGIELEGQAYGRLRTSNDFAAGVKAFNEKKKAKWSGT